MHILDNAQLKDRSQPLTWEILRDPDHAVVQVINWTYTSEGFTYRVLNHSCRVKDTSKLETMGPYSFALGAIVDSA